MVTRTKQLFRLINESRAYCVRLACAAYHNNTTTKADKEEFYKVIETIAADIKETHSLRPGKTALRSLCSNQFRFGKWLKIPKDEQTINNYFKLRQDERDNGTINPDELEHQERKTRAHEFGNFSRDPRLGHRRTIAEKRRTTDALEKKINGSAEYSKRLRVAAGLDKTNKHEFKEAVHDILNELKPNHVYANSLFIRLWKRGAWKHYTDAFMKLDIETGFHNCPRHATMGLSDEERAMWNTNKSTEKTLEEAGTIRYGDSSTTFGVDMHDPHSIKWAQGELEDALKRIVTAASSPQEQFDNTTTLTQDELQRLNIRNGLANAVPEPKLSGRSADYIILDDLIDMKPGKVKAVPPAPTFIGIDWAAPGPDAFVFDRIHDEYTMLDFKIFNAPEINQKTQELTKMVAEAQAAMYEKTCLNHFRDIYTQQWPIPKLDDHKEGIAFSTHGCTTGRWGANCYADPTKYKHPGMYKQAESRMHRQGQPSKPELYYLGLFPYQMEMIRKMDYANLEKRVIGKHAALGMGYGMNIPRRYGKSFFSEYGTKMHKQFEEFLKYYSKTTPNPTTKEFTMNIKTQTLVNGTPLDHIEDEALIHDIKRCEDQIRDYEKLQTKSAHITKEIETLKAQAVQLAGFLDARHPGENTDAEAST